MRWKLIKNNKNKNKQEKKAYEIYEKLLFFKQNKKKKK